MASARRLAKILLGLLISAGLLVYVFWNVDAYAVGARLAATSWGWLAVCGALNVVALWIRSRRWRYLFPPEGHPSHLFNALMIGFMGNNLLPLRAGEVVRVYVVSRRGARFWTAVATVVVERVLDVLAMGLILALLLFVMPIPAVLRWSALVLMSLDLAAMVVLGFMAAAPARCRALARRLVAWWPRLEAPLLHILDTFHEGLRGVRAPGHVLPLVLWSAGIWVALALSIAAALQAARLDLPFSAAWVVLVFLGLGVSLPSSPGFVGVVQAAAVMALEMFAVPRTVALAFSFALHAAHFFPVTIWGLILLVVEHVSLTEAARAGDTAAR
ncbi:MAG TPA: lysylphosphatidylglycerol synthase transmembrane domain-containing protein [Methylomirabilota bacterium]|nr:lysylphosphatidylglycerol synthase transmembrane domain-containing protein [Methylomirabilota bacterium]